MEKIKPKLANTSADGDKKMGAIMFGIRWIIGIPFGYYLYKFLMLVNIQLLSFLMPKLSFIPEVLWQIEALFINSIIAVYISIAACYFMLPRDRYAIIHNTKVKVIYWFLCLWSVIQLILLGVSVYDAFHGYFSEVIWNILYVPIMLVISWWTYEGISSVDFKYNQPYRDYLENEYNNEQQIAITE